MAVADTGAEGHRHDGEGHPHHHHDHEQHDAGDHAGADWTETLPDPSGPGSVVVDIGAGTGAAIVATHAALDGREIEIRPAAGRWVGEHVAVRPRPLPDRTMYAAFFESLAAGEYVVRLRYGPEDGPEAHLTVEGGRVAHAELAGPTD